MTLGGLVVWAYVRTPERLRRAVVRALAPTYTVGVVAVVSRPDRRILLVDQPYNHGWSLPGGDVRRGETAQAALQRELVEEVGLRVEVPEPVLAVQRLRDRWVSFCVGVDVSDELADTAVGRSPEIRSVGWFGTEQLPPIERDAAVLLSLVLRSRS